MVNTHEIELSILDLGESDDPKEYIEDVIRYGAACEQLGYKRFWMGEHYMNNTLFSNPEPLIPAIAMSTNRISIGTAGLLIRKHAVDRVACSFSLLERMFANRIDLGLVAPLHIQNQDSSLGSLKSTKEIFQEFQALFEEGNVASGVVKHSSPLLWHLTSSIKNYLLSGHEKSVNVSKTLFHGNSNFDPELDNMARLHEQYVKKYACLPTITVAVGCFVSDSEAEVKALGAFYKQFLSTELYKMCIIETPQLFLERLMQLSHKYQTKDIIIVNLGRSYYAKNECLKKMSELFDLTNAQSSQ